MKNHFTTKNTIMALTTALISSTDAVAPVAVFHGVAGSCPDVQTWVDTISESIDHQAVVKCVEIGDG